MAYGNPRRRRDIEPDIRDMVEDAARDAGLSVSAFLDQAVSEHDDAQDRRRRAPARRPLHVVHDDYGPLEGLERRLTRAPRQQDGLSEDRVARILDRAFDEIRASEDRTAALIETMGRVPAANQPALPARLPSTVAEILASAERREKPLRNVVELHPARQDALDNLGGALSTMSQAADRLRDSVARGEVEKALQLLERKLQLVDAQTPGHQLVLQGMVSEIAAIRAVVLAEGAQVPLGAIEKPIASLTERIAALAAMPLAPAAAPVLPVPQRQMADAHLFAIDRRLDDMTSSTSAMISGIHDELVRLGKHGLQRDGTKLDASFNRLENRIQQLEHVSNAPLEEIRQQLGDIQAAAGSSAESSSLRQSIRGLETKLELLSGRIAEPLRMVHNAVTQVSRQQVEARSDNGRLDQLFSELAALKRGIAEQNNGPSGAQMQRHLGQISERIEAMALRMQQNAQPPGPRDFRKKSVDEEIAEIKQLITAAKSPCDDTKVLDAIAHLERKIAALENSPQALLERLDRMQQKLDERPAHPAGPGQTMPANIELLLRNLSARLEAPPTAAPFDDRGFDRLHQEIRQLGIKLELAPPGSSLQHAGQDLSGVERSISDLFHQIDGMKTAVGDQAARAAADAVRQFAPLAPAMPVAASSRGDNAEIETSLVKLRQQQADAEQRTAHTLEALHDTLQRVVDRLGSMERDARVGAVTQQVAPPQFTPPQFTPPQFTSAPVPPVFQQPVMPVPEPPPVVPAAAAQVWQNGPVVPPRPLPQDDSSHLLPADIFEPEPPRSSPRQLAASSPSHDTPPNASFAETLASLRTPRSAAASIALAAEPVRPEPRSAVASAFAAARSAMANFRAGKADREKPEAETAVAPEPLAAPRGGSPIDLDMPLEPGSGRPAQTHPAQTHGVQTHPAQATALSAQPVDAKADFLAAARRAAQAAAQQSAEVLAQNDPRAAKKKAKAERASLELAAAAAGGGSPGNAGFRAKHAILLGCAALIVAAGAGYQFMGAAKRAESPSVAEPPVRSSSLTPSVRTPQAPSQQMAAAPARQQQAEAPRQILPPALTPEPQRQPNAAPQAATPPVVAPQASVSAQVLPAAPPVASPSRVEEPQTVGSIAPPPRVPSTSLPPLGADDPLLRFEGLRDGQKLREAARRGDPSAFIELGMRYSEGRGAVRDPKLAALWLERAAEFGSAPAQYRLGTLYREGRGVERNPKIALRHFTAAAEAGNARAMHNTAVLLAEGVNGAPDYAGASEWFKKSAEFGIRDSQYNLAILYARGLGAGQDLMASYAWFAAAAANGDEDAVKKRDEVGSRLSPERLQQARAAAAQWKAKVPEMASNEIEAPAGGWEIETKPAPAAAAAPRTPAKRN
jgi:localization factor PodJL